jgi:hypothetical protein
MRSALDVTVARTLHTTTSLDKITKRRGVEKARKESKESTTKRSGATKRELDLNMSTDLLHHI